MACGNVAHSSDAQGGNVASHRSFGEASPRKNLIWTTCVALVALTLAGGQPGHAQDEVTALKNEIEALKRGQAAIRRDLQEIKSLLQGGQSGRQQAFKPVDLSVDGSAVKGDAAAPVTLVEFSDYQCPFCRRHFAKVMPRIISDYVETGKVRYVLREFPLQRIHPKALKASEAALCAGDQGQYWSMHNRMFSKPGQLDLRDLTAHAKALGLDTQRFEGCLDGGKYAQKVRTDQMAGATAGVTGTPTFLLGLTDRNNPKKIKAIKMLRGALPYARFKQAIDELLALAKKSLEAG